MVAPKNRSAIYLEEVFISKCQGTSYVYPMTGIKIRLAGPRNQRHKPSQALVMIYPMPSRFNFTSVFVIVPSIPSTQPIPRLPHDHPKALSVLSCAEAVSENMMLSSGECLNMAETSSSVS